MTNSERPKRSGVMLCYPFEEKRLEKWDPPYIVQPKLDGVRCRAVHGAGLGYYLLSSTCHTIVSVPHIIEALNKTGLISELDGELYCHGMSFDDINSRVSRTVNLSDDADMIEFHIFDVVANVTQLERTGWLNQQSFKHPLHVVRSYIADDLDDIMKHYVQFLNKDSYEGIIVRHVDAPYMRKRSTFMMKFKGKKDDWYTVTGWKEEVDKFDQPKNRLGALICEGDDGTPFSVGSGLTSDDREKLWTQRHLLAGNLVHVQYQHLTPGKNVPRFPVFVSVDLVEEPRDD